jgi:hypothetical protein
MANKKLPKAQLGRIVKGVGTLGKIIVGAAKGASKGGKTAYKTATKIKGTSRLQTAANNKAAAEATIKRGPGRPKGTGKVQEIPEITVKGSRTKTGAGTKGTTKTKAPFVKSKARLATENITGKIIGGFPFYMLNATGKVLKNPVAQGILGTAATLAAVNRWKKTNAPKKAKKYKEK